MVLVFPDGRTETLFGAADAALIDSIIGAAVA